LRIVRRLAIALVVAVPLGFVVSGVASANFVVTPTDVAAAPALASPQLAGSESWAGQYTDAVTGGTFSGNYPEGFVTFYAGPGATNPICQSADFTSGIGGTGTGGATDGFTPSGVATVTYQCTSAAQATLVPGSAGGTTYTVTAVFTPDTPSSGLTNFTNNTVTSGTLATVVVYTLATPTSATTPSNSTPPAGSTITDTDAITATGGPTGAFNGSTSAATVTFDLFTGLNCVTANGSTGPDAVTQTSGNNGSATSGPIAVPNTTGASISISAVYSGNLFNNTTTATCENITTTTAAVSIATVASNLTTAGNVGTPITDQVNVTGLSGTNATGLVVLQLYASSNCTGSLVATYVNPLSPSTITGTSSTFTASYTPTAVGPYSWRASYGGDTNNAAFTAGCEGPVLVNPTQPTTALTITSPVLPSGTLNTFYSQTVTAAGGTTPYIWSINGGITPNLTINSATGVISGTPTALGTYNFTVKVTDSTSPTAETATQAESISITTGGLTITTPFLASGMHGRLYSETVTTSGGTGPLHFAITGGALPPNLLINPATGVISGTLGATGMYHFTVTVTDSTHPTAESASRSYTVFVS
jgi:large repetitive protein